MNRKSCQNPRLLILVAALATIAVPLVQGDGPPDDPVAAYRAFLNSLSDAKSLNDLFPHLPAETRQQMQKIPEEASVQVLHGIQKDGKSAPDGWEVVEQREADGRAHIVLRGARSEGSTLTLLENEGQLVGRR